MYGLGGDDIIYGSDGSEFQIGGTGDDTVFGGTGTDVIYGDDIIFDPLEAGNDFLYGGAGLDIVVGMYGEDVITGGDGNDELSGGFRFFSDGDADVFVFGQTSGADTITDFEFFNGGGDDKIDLTAFGLASTAFLTVTDADADGNVEVGVIGVDPAVFSIELIGVAFGDLSDNDFILS